MVGLAGIDFSYNNLTGPVSTGGILPKVTAEDNVFVGNVGLYGNTEGLTPCASSPRMSDMNNSRVLICVLVPIWVCQC